MIYPNPNHLAGHNTYTYVICNILLDASWSIQVNTGHTSHWFSFSQLLCKLSILTLCLLQSWDGSRRSQFRLTVILKKMSSSLLFQDLGNCCQNCSHCFLFRISFVFLVWLESSNICFWIFWLNVSRYFLHWSCQRFIFVFDWSFYTGSVMLSEDSIILIVNIFRVISFDNLIHIIVLRLCFVRTPRDLVDWFIFFSSLCVSFFLVSPQLSKWFPDTLSESRTAGCAGKIHRFVVH